MTSKLVYHERSRSRNYPRGATNGALSRDTEQDMTCQRLIAILETGTARTELRMVCAAGKFPGRQLPQLRQRA